MPLFLSGRARRWMPSLLVVCALALPSLAGAEPLIEVTADGTVDGRVVVGAPLQDVRDRLSDVEALRRESKDVSEVEVRRDGACQIVTTHASNIIDLVYVARRCPTETGWVETLLEAEGMTDYYAEWFLRPVPEGVEVRVRLRVGLDLPVPGRMVRSATKGNMRRSMERLLRELGPPSPPPRQVAAD